MKIAAKLILTIGIVILFNLVLLWISYASPTDKDSSQEIEFSVLKGQGNDQIADQLYKQRLVRSPIIFLGYTYVTRISGSLKAGDYLLSTSMSLPEIANQIAKGNFIQRQLQILEGWSLKNISQKLEDIGYFTQEEFFAVTGNPGIDLRENHDAPKPVDFSDEFAFLVEKPDYVSLEGFIFPDTYDIARGDTPEDIVRRALHNFQTRITPDFLQEVEAQDKTLFEVLTMASIIEKEVRSLKDKKIVSGILWKRLQEDKRLQVDATIVYVRKGNYYKVTFKELEVDSSYNTYTNYGLPPGPISNPGLESIDAALHPTESPYWFYLSPSINTTIFSETFEQHKAAADLYIR